MKGAFQVADWSVSESDAARTCDGTERGCDDVNYSIRPTLMLTLLTMPLQDPFP